MKYSGDAFEAVQNTYSTLRARMLFNKWFNIVVRVLNVTYYDLNSVVNS